MAVQEPTHRSDQIVTRLEGEIDLASVGAHGAQLLDAVRPGIQLVVDCGGVTFIDSRGIAMMMQVHETAQRLDAHVRWTNLPAHCRRLLEITALVHVLDVEGASSPYAPPSDDGSA